MKLTRRTFLGTSAAALATLTIVVVPVGAAVAAESSVPGEGLYPVKRVTESVRGWLDHDLIATHRVEELEVLLDDTRERSCKSRDPHHGWGRQQRGRVFLPLTR